MGCFENLCQKICLFFKAITVEPAFLIFAISQGLYLIVSSELYITKVCKVNLALGDEICDNIQQHKDEQAQVQKYVSTLRIYNSILQSIPSVIFALFAGPWSDTNGRKFIIVSSLFGFVLNNTVFMINIYWFYELKAEYLLFECLQDCTGGFACFFMAMNSYMADITSEKNRTKRIAFMTGLWPIGFNVGKALSGVIKTKLGFMHNFAIGMMMSLFSMVYVLFFVKDSLTIREKRLQKERSRDDTISKEDKALKEEVEPVVKLGKIRSLFDLDNFKSGFKALFLRREHNMRRYLLLIIVCFEMDFFTNVGRWTNEYLYLRRTLNFSMVDYTRYSTIVGVFGIVAQYIAIPLMSEKFKWRDSTIVMIDFGTSIVQAIVLACAKAEWMLYIGAVVAFLDSTSSSMMRCIISKNVRPDEVGKVLATTAAIQAFMPIISTPVFGLIYRATLVTLPQTYIIVIITLLLLNLINMFYIDRGMRRINIVKEDLKVELQAANQQLTVEEKLSAVE